MNTDQVKSEELSQAVVMYLGFGVDSLPTQKRALLLETFGAESGALLAEVVVSLVDEISRTKINWSLQSLESAGEMAMTEMRSRHPELTESALQALKWKFTYDWR